MVFLVKSLTHRWVPHKSCPKWLFQRIQWHIGAARSSAQILSNQGNSVTQRCRKEFCTNLVQNGFSREFSDTAASQGVQHNSSTKWLFYRIQWHIGVAMRSAQILCKRAFLGNSVTERRRKELNTNLFQNGFSREFSDTSAPQGVQHKSCPTGPF
jgi:hypothetical protein